MPLDRDYSFSIDDDGEAPKPTNGVLGMVDVDGLKLDEEADAELTEELDI